METNYERLRAFTKELFEVMQWPEGSGIDGGEFEGVAERHGLLIKEKRYESCGEDCQCAGIFSEEEFKSGIDCYRQADWLFGSEDQYTRPELTDEDGIKAQADVLKLVQTFGLSNFAKIIATLCLENIRLTKEINEHRAARGIEPLPVFKV